MGAYEGNDRPKSLNVLDIRHCLNPGTTKFYINAKKDIKLMIKRIEGFKLELKNNKLSKKRIIYLEEQIEVGNYDLQEYVIKANKMVNEYNIKVHKSNKCKAEAIQLMNSRKKLAKILRDIPFWRR